MFLFVKYLEKNNNKPLTENNCLITCPICVVLTINILMTTILPSTAWPTIWPRQWNWFHQLKSKLFPLSFWHTGGLEHLWQIDFNDEQLGENKGLTERVLGLDLVLIVWQWPVYLDLYTTISETWEENLLKVQKRQLLPLLPSTNSKCNEH